MGIELGHPPLKAMADPFRGLRNVVSCLRRIKERTYSCSGQAFRAFRPLRGDFSFIARFLREFSALRGVPSAAGVPVTVGDSIFGAVVLRGAGATRLRENRVRILIVPINHRHLPLLSTTAQSGLSMLAGAH